MATLNVRIDEKTKVAANKIFSQIGFDMSSAVKVFLSQVIVEGGMPFKPTTNPAEIRAKWDAEVSDAIKSNKRFVNASDALSGL
jgi:DNA-damage-inducible protein J